MNKLPIVVLLFTSLAHAQTPHRFLDKANAILHTASAAAMVADLATTEQALSRPGTRELNPLGQTRGERIGLKVAGFGAELALSYALHRTGHHKAERMIPVIFGSISGAAAIHNTEVK